MARRSVPVSHRIPSPIPIGKKKGTCRKRKLLSHGMASGSPSFQHPLCPVRNMVDIPNSFNYCESASQVVTSRIPSPEAVNERAAFYRKSNPSCGFAWLAAGETVYSNSKTCRRWRAKEAGEEHKPWWAVHFREMRGWPLHKRRA